MVMEPKASHRSGLARKMAIAGIVVGLAFMSFHWFDLTFNPFHLPSSNEAPANYSQPRFRG